MSATSLADLTIKCYNQSLPAKIYEPVQESMVLFAYAVSHALKKERRQRSGIYAIHLSRIDFTISRARQFPILGVLAAILLCFLSKCE